MKTSKQDTTLRRFEIESVVDYAVVHEPDTTNAKGGAGDFRVSLRATTDKEKQGLLNFLNENNISETVFNPKTKKPQSRIKQNDDGTHTLTIKRPAKNSKGVMATIEVVDSQGNTIPKTVLIGNGSKAVVSGFIYENDGETVMRLSGLQVLELVPYIRKSSFKPREGFTVNSVPSSQEDQQDSILF